MSDNDGVEEGARGDEPPEVDETEGGGRAADEAGEDVERPGADAAGGDTEVDGTDADTDETGEDDDGTGDDDDGDADEADIDGEDSDETAGEVDESALDPAGTTLVAEVATGDEALAADVEEHLLALVAERDEAKVRADAAEQRVEEAETRAEELASKLKRKQADFENYKKRAERRQEEIRERATEDLVERLLAVRDNLARAVEDDHDDVASLREGVKLTLEELDRVLDGEGVSEIAPEPGDEVDPQRHEVMLRVESDQPEDAVAEVHRSGFEMADRVLRPAQVTVSEGPDDGSANDDEATSDGGTTNDDEAAGDDEGASDGATGDEAGANN